MTMGCCFTRKSRSITGLEEGNRLIPHSLEQSVTYSASRARIPSIRNNVLDPRLCTVTWRQLQPTVGGLSVADIRLICGNGSSYSYSRTDYFQVQVQHAYTEREVHCVVEPTGSLVGRSLITVSYTVRVSGEYSVLFMMNGQIIDKIHRPVYQAGPPDPNKTVFHLRAPNIIMETSVFYPILFSPKDSFGNVAALLQDELIFEARKNSPDSPLATLEYVINQIDDDDEERFELLIKIDSPGYYLCCVRHMDRIIGLTNAIAIVLTNQDTIKMKNNITTLFLNIGYKSRMIQNNNRSTKEVWCYLSPRMLQVRGYTLGVISKRLFTCRVCNSTQFIMHSAPERFTIDDGLQPPVTLISPEREVMAAIYYQFIQRNIGGSFQDKVRHFQAELRRQNETENRLDVRITVRRFELLETSMSATSSFSEDMWKRHFFVSFEGEAGIDVGGVSREFINCLCEIMFSGRNPQGLFKGFKQDDMQALVHPNYRKKRDKQFGLAHYRFAGLIVGKCLYETAMGNRLLVRAKFTRSFLAQIVGLRLTWKHFETDDPDLYNYQVKNIKDGDIADLDLSLKFAEEEYNSSTNDSRLVSITPGGTKIPVTETNKMDYLNQLAQHRLGKKVSEEMREFLKGLHMLIPDELIAIFDENELEVYLIIFMIIIIILISPAPNVWCARVECGGLKVSYCHTSR
uniref:HECT-type E3 ubiquitin transferase n=1 Tax=Amphimedon queenslandica TaxID=400682 RepID=A0A1X7VDY5_AMPQE